LRVVELRCREGKKMALEIRTKEKLKEVLRDPSAQGPDNAYYMMRGIPNITIWEPGFYGQEFNKTYGHYHLHNEPETYQVLFGEGIGILQHRSESGEVYEVRLVKVKQGDTVKVPQGAWGHAFANTGKTYLITSDDARSDASHSQNDYLPVKEKQGMAYYIVTEGGEVKIIPNPNYKNLPDPKWVDPD